MTRRCLIFSVLAIGLLMNPALACSKVQPSSATPSHRPMVFPRPVLTPTLRSPTVVPATATSSPVPPTLTVTVPTSGPALVKVQFALEVDQNGQLVFPAAEFLFGVTRVYVRFVYQGLEDVEKVETVWYQNENPVSIGNLAWDGGETGAYIIWIEDPSGLGRGEWRWELVVDGAALGGGAFTVGGAPGHVNAAWGLSFDPPASWKIESESPQFVSFSSPDQKKALALRFTAQATALSGSSAAQLVLFMKDHPAAKVVAEEEATMSGKKALLQQVRYTDQEGGEQFLFIVTALHAGSAYSLWVLGPSDDISTLKTVLADVLRSIRFSADR